MDSHSVGLALGCWRIQGKSEMVQFNEGTSEVSFTIAHETLILVNVNIPVIYA